jgi:hypothetical protein
MMTSLLTKSPLLRKERQQEMQQESEIDPEFLAMVEATDTLRERLLKDLKERPWMSKEKFRSQCHEALYRLKSLLQLSRVEKRWAEGIESTMYQLVAYLTMGPERWAQRWGDDIFAVRTEISRARG